MIERLAAWLRARFARPAPPRTGMDAWSNLPLGSPRCSDLNEEDLRDWPTRTEGPPRWIDNTVRSRGYQIPRRRA